jgi:hypothetical protein
MRCGRLLGVLESWSSHVSTALDHPKKAEAIDFLTSGRKQ